MRAVAVAGQRLPVGQRDGVGSPGRRRGGRAVRQQVGGGVVLARVAVPDQVVERELPARTGAAVAAGRVARGCPVAERGGELRAARVGRLHQAVRGVRRDLEEVRRVAGSLPLQERHRLARGDVGGIGPVAPGHGRGERRLRVVLELDLAVGVEVGALEAPAVVGGAGEGTPVAPAGDVRRRQLDARDGLAPVAVEELAHEAGAVARVLQGHAELPLLVAVRHERLVAADRVVRVVRRVREYAGLVRQLPGHQRRARGAAQRVDDERVVVGRPVRDHLLRVGHGRQQLEREVVHQDQHDVRGAGRARGHGRARSARRRWPVAALRGLRRTGAVGQRTEHQDARRRGREGGHDRPETPGAAHCPSSGRSWSGPASSSPRH
jgi:hypothetical protein